jgi:hypothetical protein
LQFGHHHRAIAKERRKQRSLIWSCYILEVPGDVVWFAPFDVTSTRSPSRKVSAVDSLIVPRWPQRAQRTGQRYASASIVPKARSRACLWPMAATFTPMLFCCHGAPIGAPEHAALYFLFWSVEMDMPITRNGTALAAEIRAPISKVDVGDDALTKLKYSSNPVMSTKTAVTIVITKRAINSWDRRLNSRCFIVRT